MMTNLNYGEIATCEPRDMKPETAMSILESMDNTLKDLSDELRRIDDAIYSPRNVGSTDDSNEPTGPECFLGKLSRQRLAADTLLHLAIHIREGLW